MYRVPRGGGWAGPTLGGVGRVTGGFGPAGADDALAFVEGFESDRGSNPLRHGGTVGEQRVHSHRGGYSEE